MDARDYLGEDARNNADATIMNEAHNELLQTKWAGLLEDVADPWTKRCMAQLYENQIQDLYKMKKKFLSESTTAANIPDLVKFIFPVVRRVWANLLSNGLFSVQPTTSPIGGIFYWEYKHGTSKGAITAGDNMIQKFDKWYSSEYVEGEVIAAGPGVTNPTGTIVWKPIKPWGMGQVGIEFTAVADSDGSAKRIYDASGDGVLVGDNAVAGDSTINYTSGVYDITFDEAVSSVVANYYYNMEGVSANVPEVNVDITLEAIKVQSRKLKMLWSSEAADDLRAVLGMNIEPELTSGVASEISLGIDREMIDLAYNSGTTNVESFDAAVPPGRNQADHYRNIATVLEKVSGEINRRTLRGPGNFIIIGPSLQPLFGALATHGDLVRVYNDQPPIPQGQGNAGRPSFPLPQAPQGYGIYTLGWLQNKWLVVVDPYFPAGKIMVGLKGSLFTDAGVVYAPYVPLEMTTAFLDPADFTLRKGMRTRYAKKLVNNEFYGIITVTNYV
jgi:hypothetical protein